MSGASVIASFQDFVKKSDAANLKEMAAGASSREVTLPITPSMGYFLTFFNEENRERTMVFTWLLTEGLKQASQGRDKLTEQINQAIGGVQGTVQTGDDPSADAGAVAVGESVNEDQVGFQPIRQGAGIEAVDVFSPLARERHPLGDPEVMKRIEQHLGMGIDEYYAKNYEPRHMEIPFPRSNSHRSVDIQEVNSAIRKLGLPEFKYGGVDGYIQYTEKGDWKPEQERRSYGDINQQHGDDLSNAQNAIIGDQPVIRFGPEGDGAFRIEIKRLEYTMSQMGQDFNRWAEEIEKGSQEKPEGMSDDEFEKFKAMLLAQKEIKRSEAIGTPARMKIAKFRYGLMPHSPKDYPLSSKGSYFNELMNYIRVGLTNPIKIGIDMLTDDSWKQKSVWANLEVDGDSYQATLTEDARNILWNFITKELGVGFDDEINIDEDDQPNLYTKWRWHNLFDGVEKGRKDDKGYLSVILNSGFTSDPDYKNIKTLQHSLDVPGKNFLRVQDTETIPLTDEIEDNLVNMGYTWRTKDGKSPEWSMYDVGEGENLAIGNEGNIQDFIRVVKGKEYPLVRIPVLRPKKDQERSERIQSRRMIVGGGTVKGGRGLEGWSKRPSADYNDLEAQLLRGEIGESDSGQPFESVNELPSVKDGISYGIKMAMSYGYDNDVPKNQYDKNKIVSHSDLLSWGTQGLWGFSGDQAFQFGYLTDAEFKHTLSGWTKKGKRTAADQLGVEPERGSIEEKATGV